MPGYAEYNTQYQHMNSLIAQIQNYSGSGAVYSNSLLRSLTGGSMNFSEIFRSVSSNLSVPESMDKIFEEAAAAYQVPEALLKAVGKAESGFDPSAVSSAGAQGVMQLMPATAQALGVTDSFDARSNIFGGAKYISNLLRQYDGDIDLTLAAYNAGSGNVAKYGGVPPFEETRNYIQKVRSYMGTELTAGSTQTAQKNEETGLVYDDTATVSFDKEDALHLVELMKLQMQNRVIQAAYGEDVSGNQW